ncbi:MAG: cupin domain-containing protein [Candidatus Entotheonellia bacterium]
MMKRIGWAVLMGMSLVAGSVRAENHAFEFGHEVKQGEQRPGFTNKVMVKTATFTVGAVAVKEEIKPHRHHDGAHVLYIVSGDGIMTHGDQTITLKPGMIVHVPVGVAHGIKAEDGELTLVDFAQPPFDPNKMEWIK